MDWSSIFAAYWRELLAATAIVTISLSFWWLWPKQKVKRLQSTMPDAKAQAEIEDSLRKTIGQLLGVVAFLAGAGFFYLQFQQQQQAFERQYQQQQRASRDQLISNQISKGFEQLGSNKIELRLGGIYMLESVMDMSDQYHKPVLEALSAFVRDRTKTQTGEEAPATDIQATLTVIGRRVVRDAQPDLTNAHIPKANLFNANLSNAFLNNTDLSGANLSGANLSGANLSGANLSGANLSRANLSGANLSGANLSNAILGSADIRGANLSGANLRRAILSDTILRRAALSGADLRGADLHSGSLHNADLSNADLRGADLRDGILNNTDLSNADLRGAVGLLHRQLDMACGTDAKLDPGLTVKPCSVQVVPPVIAR